MRPLPFLLLLLATPAATARLDVTVTGARGATGEVGRALHASEAGRAGMRMGATDSPATVADGLVAALGRRALVRPGMLSKALEFALTPLPRRGRVWMMGRVMSGMARHVA